MPRFTVHVTYNGVGPSSQLLQDVESLVVRLTAAAIAAEAGTLSQPAEAVQDHGSFRRQRKQARRAPRAGDESTPATKCRLELVPQLTPNVRKSELHSVGANGVEPSGSEEGAAS
jgi:hypothetical protein